MEDIQLTIESLEKKLENSNLTISEYQGIRHNIEELKLALLHFEMR